MSSGDDLLLPPDPQVDDSESDDDDDDEHTFVGEQEFAAVAHQLYLPVESIVRSVVQEAERDQENSAYAGSSSDRRDEDHNDDYLSNGTTLHRDERGGGDGSDGFAPEENNINIIVRRTQGVSGNCSEAPLALSRRKSGLLDREHTMMMTPSHSNGSDGNTQGRALVKDEADVAVISLRSHTTNQEYRSRKGSNLTSSGPFGSEASYAARERNGTNNSSRPQQASGPSPKSEKRFVSFAASEIERVHVFEVDNSLFISIEYARPLVGWFMLLVALLCGSVTDVIYSYHMASNDQVAYAISTATSFGSFFVLSIVLLPFWYFCVKPTPNERSFLMSREGILLVLVTALMGSLSMLAQSATAHLVSAWRTLALSGVHPAVIVLFGKIFRNTVFVEEAVGSMVMLAAYAVAMLPVDVTMNRWEFGEILALSYGIYIASFLFLAVKARANHVSIPVVAAAVSILRLVIFCIVCGIANVPFVPSRESPHAPSPNAFPPVTSKPATPTQMAVFDFYNDENQLGVWIFMSICSAVSLLCYLLTLRFIPPLTVSVAMCVQALAVHFASYLLFFNEATSVWNVCPVTKPPTTGPFDTPTTSDSSSDTFEQRTQCGDGGVASTQNVMFTVGAVVAVVAAGYLVYISSIKRSKVELLLKQLRSRKTPKNPYQKNRGRQGAGTVAIGASGLKFNGRRDPHHPHNRERAARLMLLNASSPRRSVSPPPSDPRFANSHDSATSLRSVGGTEHKEGGGGGGGSSRALNGAAEVATYETFQRRNNSLEGPPAGGRRPSSSANHASQHDRLLVSERPVDAGGDDYYDDVR